MVDSQSPLAPVEDSSLTPCTTPVKKTRVRKALKVIAGVGISGVAVAAIGISTTSVRTLGATKSRQIQIEQRQAEILHEMESNEISSAHEGAKGQ